jgi:ATP-dependent helicase/nuclease subunit B
VLECRLAALRLGRGEDLPTAHRIYTVPPGRPFLAALADALLQGELPVPGGTRPGALQLADATVLLPTRRATRALQEAFLRASGGSALLLPKIRPIVGITDESLGGLGTPEDLATDSAGELLPAISDMARQLALTRLIMAWSEAEGGTRTPAQAAKLARELARLMDAMEIEDVDPMRLGSLVPDAFAAHWEPTLKFLGIVTRAWPAHLKEHGLVSQMQHAKHLVLAQARRLEAAPPPAPVIAAGVMSSVPVVTELLRVVTGLPNGALVLPGLDQSLDAESWESIVPAHPEHPQFGLKKLLDALGVRREDVAPLPGPAPTGPQRARAILLSEAMRPARTTERWHRLAVGIGSQTTAQALAGVDVLEAPGAEDEAEAVALILREAAETPGRTAALVTPDRALGRRVAARLATWQLRVEDSAGQPLGKTAIGAFLDLIIEAAASGMEPVALLALLKHPLCRLGVADDTLRRGWRTLELALFRATYLGAGLDGVAAALERAQADVAARRRLPQAVRRLGREDWKAARDLVRRLAKALKPFEELFAASAKVNLAALIAAHTAAAEALGRAATAAPDALWGGDAGEAAAKFLATLRTEEGSAPHMRAVDYPAFYRSLAEEVTVRLRAPTHPRIFIWEPYESRLQHTDVVILGSLNEGTWPQVADPGPWLNRPMRHALGLPAPEERIGDAAHIFTSLFGARQAYLTRAAKIDGVPTVPSRWILRLQALMTGSSGRAGAEPPWLAWARERNAMAGPARPVRAPEPRPALLLRPRQMSATSIETWIANPYAVFAERILRLEVLPALGRQPDAALRGQIVHEALGRFAQRFPDRLPDDICAELAALAEAALEELAASPRVAAFWAPRFGRFAQWFADTERARRSGTRAALAEVEGAMVLEGKIGPFTLKARADRIDVGDSGLAISDYKTGNVSDLKRRAEQGRAPQLPLEAAIAMAGGFTGLPAQAVLSLRYISASGGEPPGQECALDADVARLAREARDGLSRLIAAFDDEDTPYRALRRARFNYRFDDYAQLARVAEWSGETVEEA